MTGGFLVEPRGNAYLIDREVCGDDFINAKQGLGKLMHALGGVEVVNEKVFCYLNSQDLCRLSSASRTLWTLIEADEGMWRDLALNELSPVVLDKRMLLACKQEKQLRNMWKMIASGNFTTMRTTYRFGRLFCDALLRPLQCAQCEIKPEWTNRTNVTRVDMKNLSCEEFITKFESKRLPVVITTDGQMFARGIVRWRRGLQLGMQTLQGDVNEKRFRAGPGSLSGPAFAVYANTFQDENPMYIFDSEFGGKFPELAGDYQVPPYFTGEGRDLFELFPGTHKDNVRPDYRWIIAGGAKSGSKWHVDPNCTHAWNVSLLGKKKWIMLPPGQAPPVGVFPSQDGGSVAQPVSLSEWFLEFYSETRRTRKHDMIEFVADVGDIVFVPSGWWHCVLNLEESYAVTQNYVSKTNLGRVLRFFDEKPDQISGLRRGGKQDRRMTFCQEFKSLLPKEWLVRKEEAAKVAEEATFSWTSLVAEKKTDTGNVFKFSFGS